MKQPSTTKPSIDEILTDFSSKWSELSYRFNPHLDDNEEQLALGELQGSYLTQAKQALEALIEYVITGGEEPINVMVKMEQAKQLKRLAEIMDKQASEESK